MASKKSIKNIDNSDATMKVIIVVALILAFVGGYMVARAKYKPQLLELSKMVSDKDQAMQKMKTEANKVMMKDGAMWVVENGLVKTMDADIMLKNGDKVTTEGKVVKSDGTESTLQNGDAVSMEGSLMPNGGANVDTATTQF